MDDNKRKLYDALSQDYDMGTFEQFSNDIKDAGKRQKLYDAIKDDYDLPDFDGFTKQLGVGGISQEQIQNSLQQKMYPNGVKPTKPVNTPKAHPVQQPQQQPKQQGGYKPTWQEQWAFGITTNRAEDNALNATMPVDQRQANAETYNKKVIGQAPKLGKAGRVVEDNGGYITSDATKHNNLIDANLEQLSRDSSFNLARMEEQLGALFENRERIQAELDKVSQQWVDSDGYVHSTRGGDGTRYDELVKEYQDNERAINDIATNEQLLQYRENQAQKSLRDISKQEEQLAARREKAEDDRSFLGKFFDTVSNITHRITDPFGFMPTEQQIKEGIGAYGKELQDIAKEENILGHRRELVQDAQNLLNEYRYEQQGGAGNLGLVTAARNVWNTAAKKSTWDSGISEFDRNYTIMQAIMKQDNGQPLSDNEKALLNDWAYNNAVSGQYNDELSGWAKAGMVTGESLPFMLEMALNPLSGLGEAATKKLTQYAIKRYGSKWVKDHLKSYVAGKVATKLATDVVGAYGMAGTSGIARTAADALRRETGEVNIDVDQNGDIIYNGIKQDTKEEPLMAFAKAFTNTGIENWSEMAGSYLGFLGDYFGKVIGKSVIGKAGREMLSATGSIEGVSLNKAQKFIYELAAGKGIGAFSKGLADFAKRTQWHGVGGEYLEEVMGNIANAATVGDMNFGTGENGVFNLQENIDTFCGVALMGGFMSALHTGGFVAHKINYNPDVVSAENSKVFGDELWSDIKTMIDNSYTDPRELNNALTYILRGDSGKQYSQEEKKAVLKYTQAILEKEGREMAEYQPRMASSSITEVTGEGGKKQWQVTSSDINGDAIVQQNFDTEEEAKAFEGELKMQQQKRDLDDYMSMSTKLSFSEANNIIDEFMASVGIDENSDAYDETLADINDPNTELGKQFQQFKYNKVIEKARASQAAIAQFEQDNGWTPGTVRWLAEQDPMQLDAEGLQMQDQARLFLEGLAYPPTEVNVEHAQQVGADAGQEVVEKVVSTEEPIYPDNNIGKDIQDQWDAAQAARQAAFDADENLKEEVERKEQMQLSPQEIIASLDWARPEQIQAMIDYYNAKARYEGMVNAAAKKIDEEAANSRQRHTFKGTIDGTADLNTVYQITDGTNTYYLVSGDVTTNPTTGQITDSNSGLIIGLDDNGDFVQISDTEGYSVVNTGQSLAQFEEAERERLQQETTRVIMPNGPQMQPAEVQSGNQDNAGDEAGGTNTGANNPPATAPSTETEQPQPQPVQIPVDEKTGVKLYHEGQQSIDETINDMQKDGWDVNMMSQANINKAQKQLDKVNQKIQNGDFEPQDLMEQKRLQAIVDYYNNVKARWAEMNAEEQPAESEENVNVQPEQPTIEEKPVSSQQETEKSEKPTNLTVEEQKQQRIAEAKAKYGELFDDDFTKANDVYELVSMWVGRKRNLAWDDVNGKRGLQKELGWTRKIGGDTKYIETLLAKKGEGMGVDEFAHMVWESPENSIMGEKRWSTEEIKDALLELLKSAGSKSDVVDYALNTRINAAEAAIQEEQKRTEEEAEQEAEIEPLTAEQIADMEASMPFAQSTDEEIEDHPLNQLRREVEALMQEEGMPPIQLVDTERMNDGDWINLANELMGYFLSQEEVDYIRQQAMEQGVIYFEQTGNIVVFSGAITPEALREKFEQLKEISNEEVEQGTDGTSDEQSGNTDLGAVPTENAQGYNGESQSPATNTDSESQGSTESVEDSYLQPRNAEEEQIIANVIAQLQQEIGEAVEEQNKARSELEKAMARESERATDMFGNDNALNQPGQLFDNSDMPIDQSVEGVERRTAAEREKLQEATNKLNQLQSEQERNSRIRGALDNYRRQTKIDTDEQPLSDNPIEAIEQAAQQFREEQAEKNYGADNKLVTTERYEELKKKMRDKLRGQLNVGVDPEMIAIGAEMAMFHIEAGARKFADYATRMINDLGDAIRPYLQGFYEASRRMPGMEQLRKEMDSTEFVDNFDVLSYDKQNDNTVNEHKQENNEPENSVSLQQETSEEVQRKAEDADKYRAFSQAVANDMLNAMETGEKPYKSIKDIRAKAKEVGLDVDDEGRTDILLQELVEDGLVSAARQYVNTYVLQQMLSGKNAAEVRQSRDLFNDIVKLYNLQPSITQRSSNRIKMQQYSTPLPMSFVADVFAYKEGMEDVLEPTAGNGMMVFAIPETVIHANELDETRLDNLRAQKFKEVTDQDATQTFEGREYDAIVANPPFGGAVAKEYDGKMIPGLAEQIALNALSKMKDDGRAAIIIGGNMEYAPNGAIKTDKAFFTYLYDHYNVKGVIDMDGKLYSKQGTTYPTRLILIDGRRSEEERAQVKVYPPVLKDSPMKVKTFEELFDVAEELRKDNRKTNGNEVLRTSESGGLLDHSNTPRNTNGERRSGQPNENVSHAGQPERRVAGRRNSDRDTSRDLFGGLEETPRSNVDSVRGLGDSGVSEQSPATAGREASPNNGSTTGRGGETSDRERSAANNVGQAERNEPSRPNNVGERRTDERIEEKRELSSDKLPYRPHNTAFSLESVAPAAMVEAMDNTLKAIEKQYGNIDSFVTKELGYDSIKDMHNALAAEQVDSVAMAIWNMKNGEGMIIGDQTGVGKGRQMAALIRWAVKQGKKPIFVTKDADLFSDIYRDLVDIGSGELRPFIFNSGVTITDANGVVVHKSLSDVAQKKVLAMNELPEGFDFAILSYPQMNTGDRISQEESGKAAKDRGEWGSKKGKAVKAGRPTPKADFLRRIAKDNYLLMDESQNAAGSGNTGAYFQSILKDAKAVTFASATFAKRPDTMPLYAIRTAISKAKVKTWELLQMIGKGGVTLQEIMSRAMTQAGQMVRRERDMSDVKTDWKTITDKATAEKARRNYDNVMRAFNAIIDFQDNYIKPALAAKSIEFAEMASSVSSRRGTEKAGVDNPPFVNRLYNFSKQLLLSLKVDAVVDEVVSEIEAGRHPVIALENTLESALDEYGVGDVIEDPTLFGKLKKGLDATFRYTLKNEDGDEMGGELQPHELGPEGEQAYYNLVDLIQESTKGMFISPLDAITEKLEGKGYRVGEISGRKTRAVLNKDGQYVVRKRENTDRKKLARDFNSGDVDVLIINKTGSTGISLHASSRFSDQRQRTMIMAQPLSDINDYMQMIGRIDRTGQVHRGYYINLGLPVPAETRFMMMLANKLKSLNANTTTSQENKDNDVDAPDLLNKYGDQVMIEYLRDNPDVYRKLGEFLKDKSERGAENVSAARLDEYQPKEGDAKQITGRVALLSVDEQDAFYDDVTRRYNELIKYLNDTGSNDLKISVLPLNARTIDREVSSEGTAPNSGNPFADNAYVEWVDMDILKKPMKASEVGKTIEQLSPEGKIQQIISTVERETQEKIDKENERYEAAKKRVEEDIEAKAEAINKQQKRTAEQKKEAIDKYASERRQAVEESHQNMVNKIDANHGRLMKYLKMFGVGDSVLVPDDLTTDAFLGSSNGIFCGFKCKDENITPSTTLAVFATLDGRRKIEVKLSDWGALTRINNMTEQNWDAAHEVTLSNWDEKIPSSSRKKGYIMTGNILQAISDTNFQGRLVTFTDDKGNVRDGVLMPDKWEPSQLKGSTVPISARKERITTMPMKESVTSSDGRVTITRYWAYYNLDVPKSKKQGGEFYLDKTLLDLVDGNDFFTASGKMRAHVDNSNINAVLDRLGEMSVTLPSDKKVEFNPEQADARITTDNPLEAIEQAAYAFRNEQGFYQRTKEELDEITKRVMDIPKRFGLKAAITQVINSRSELEQMKGKVSDSVYKMIEQGYNKKGVTGVHISGVGIVVVFGEKVADANDAELTWWHEQTHNFWHSLPADLKEKYGRRCLAYLNARYKKQYDQATAYWPGNWNNEACSFFMEAVINEFGMDEFMSSNFAGDQIICNFANDLRNYLRNGTGQQQGSTGNQLRRSGAERLVLESSGRGHIRGRDEQSAGDRQEAEGREVDYRITDPLEAIHNAADSWRRERKEQVEGIEEINKYSAKEVYHDRINRAESVTTEAFQDDMVTFKNGQNAIAHDKEVPDSQNAYQAANLAYGKTYNEQEQFTNIYRTPLEETILAIMRKMGWQTGDVDRYLFTKHGLERNRELFVRDWFKEARNRELEKEEKDQLDELENEYVELKQENYQKLMAGDMTFAEYLNALDSFIRDNIDSRFDAEKSDYSGFTEMFGDEDGNFNEAEILANLSEQEEAIGKELLDKMWEKVNLCSQLGLTKYRDTGMMSEDTYKRVTNMFHWYVPMRGWSESEAAQDHWQYMTVKEGTGTVGGLLRHAAGRKSEAGFPLATLFAMTYKAISDGNQNVVKQHFYRLCQANPNDLVIITDTWAVMDETTGEWTVVYPDINSDMSPQLVEQKTIEFDKRMKQLQAEGKAKKVKGNARFDYKIDKTRQREHIVEVMINGQRKMMVVTGNPRMAQAINGQLRYERGKGKWNQFVGSVKQFQQTVSTSYNLTFLGRNMARDWTHFGALLTSREGAGYMKAAQEYYFEQMPKMVSLFKKYRKNSLDMSNEMERDFKDFMDNGGITGFVQMQKVEELQKDIQRMLSDKGKVKKIGNAFFDKTLGAVQAMNEAIENNARFATYRASRHYAGRTKARSAYDAKEVTVNFNKKGAGRKTSDFKSDNKRVRQAATIAGETSQILMANKMFFNATMQAICNIFRGLKNPDGSINYKYAGKLASIYAAPPFAMGLLMPVINAALLSLAGGDDGDDPYANLPEWVRRKNLCIYTGWATGNKNDFLVIPMGQELAAFYSMGDMMAGITYREDLKPIDKTLFDEMVGFLNVFSPVDFESKVTNEFSPVSEFVGRICSPVAPLVAIGENIGWTGKPIYRRDKYQGDEYTPEYQMTLGNTNSAYISLSKWLNDVSGGDDVHRGALQVNPSAMQYLFEQYIGGPGKFFMNTGSAVGDAYKWAFTDDEPDFNIRKIEFFRAFWQQGDERTELYRTQAKYRRYQQEANEFYHDFHGYEKDATTNPDHYMKAMEMSQDKGYIRMQMVKEADKTLKKLNTAANQATGRERKNLRALYNNALLQVVNELDKVRDIE